MMLAPVVRERLDEDAAQFIATFLTHVVRVDANGPVGDSYVTFRSLLEVALAADSCAGHGWRALCFAVQAHLADTPHDRIESPSYAYLAAFVRENGDLL